MKKFLLTLLFFSSTCFGQADWLNPAGMTKVMEGVDDGTYHVSLGHSFPYYGGVFTDAWMSSNGVILLYDPTSNLGNPNTYNSMCCSGQNLLDTNQGYFSFMLAPLWTDLRDANLNSTDGYYYKTNEGVSSFLWYNVVEYGTQNLNTFQANLWPDGSFDFLYDDVNVTRHQVTIGFSGDISLGDSQQMVHQYGFTNQNLLAGNWWDQLVNPGGVIWYGQDGGYNSSLDCSNALNDPKCPGYEEAYYDQQCSYDALYDTGCQGYEQAYFDLQCSYDDLYDSMCPGYDQALLLQDMAGTDFVFGDDITDFYDTEPQIEEEMFVAYEDTSMDMFEEEDIYGYTEDTGYEDTGSLEYDETESYDDGGTLHGGDSYEEVYTEPVVYEDDPGLSEEPIVDEGIEMEEAIFEGDGEDIAIEDEYIEEDITHMEEDVSNIEENLLITEETVSINGPRVDAVGIALTTAATAEANAVQVAEQAQSNISVSLNVQSVLNETNSTRNETQQEFTFGALDSLAEDATFNMIVDPTITVDVITAVESPTEQASQQEEEQTVDFQMESTTPQMDTGFAAQQDQSFSTGQSITAVLNNVAPNFSQFDVAPPSQQEQRQTARAEAAANNMSQEDIEASIERMSGDMQDSGGFTDQSLTIFLIGRVNGFDAYNTQLQDVSFYTDRGMPGGRVQNDRNTMLQLIGTSGKHEEMVAEQYK